jgi:hypothetical protein
MRGSLKVPVSTDRQSLDGDSRTPIPDEFGMTVVVR